MRSTLKLNYAPGGEIFAYKAAIHFSILAFTASSILINGGHARLKPSPGNFFVASIPSLLPMAISLVA
jgi:hypothetical protein